MELDSERGKLAPKGQGIVGETKKVGLYARTSTARDQNPRMQIDELRVMAKQRGWQIVGEYVDHGVSGSKDRRPELDRLHRDVVLGKIEIVACYRFDRYARSLKHLVTAMEEFQVRGIDFVSIHDAVDTSTPSGKFIFHIFAAMSEFEKELIRERVMSGLQAARRRGEKLGRPRVRVDIARALSMRSQGKSYRDIARTLGIGVGTVHRAIKGSRHDSVPETQGSVASQGTDIEDAA